jgi:hypothetical protein
VAGDEACIEALDPSSNASASPYAPFLRSISGSLPYPASQVLTCASSVGELQYWRIKRTHGPPTCTHPLFFQRFPDSSHSHQSGSSGRVPKPT